MAERNGHISSLPTETLLQILGPTRTPEEGPREHRKRLVGVAGVNKKLASILRPALYDRVTIMLGDNVREDENPADDQMRHLRRCSSSLTDTTHVEVDGEIINGDNITSAYQRLSINHIALAVLHTPKCTHLTIRHAEILDPAGEHKSERREQAATRMPTQRDIAEGEEESPTHRSIGVGTRESKRERKRREMAEADEREPMAAAPPRFFEPLRALTIHRTYSTTPNAIIATLSLFPRVESVILSHIFWSTNNSASPLPDAPHHCINRLVCLDINFDVTSDYSWPHSTTVPDFPAIPVPLTHPGLVRQVRTLLLGYTDDDWMNGADILAWTKIPLNEYGQLQELELCTVALRQEWDSATKFFSRGAASLLLKAPISLRKVRITIISEMQGDEWGPQHLNPTLWKEMSKATPPQIEDVRITIAVDGVDRQLRPLDTHQASIIRDAFSSQGRPPPTIEHTTKGGWLREHGLQDL